MKLGAIGVKLILGISCMAASACLMGQSKISTYGGCELVGDQTSRYTLKLDGESGEGSLLLSYSEDLLDLSAFSHFVLDAVNQSSGKVQVKVNVSSTPGNMFREINSRFFFDPQQEREMRVLIFRDNLPKTSAWVKYFPKTKALPGFQKKWIFLDAQNIKRVTLGISWSGLTGTNNTMTFSQPKGQGQFALDTLSPESLPQPLVDGAGQLVDTQWDGKVNNLSELATDGKKDLAQFSKNSVRPGFNKFGGWLAGPRFESTGQFYTKKVDGKWWFVDPEGYLFWSLGVTGVGFGESTLITGREKFFPKKESLDQTPRFWSADDRELEDGEEVYNFVYSNLKKKYGEDWVSKHTQVTLGRMQQWGLNTCGAWPMNSFLGQQRVPYTLIIHPTLQVLGSIDKIPDPFSKEFKSSLISQVKGLAKYKKDPWNLGVFINNELHWYGGIRVPLAIVALDSSVPAKRAMVDFLRKRYSAIDALNKAWGSSFENFDAVREPKISGEQRAAFGKDLTEYYDVFADAYYSLCASTLKRLMPGHLYLGSRIHGDVYGKNNPMVQRAASRHCDAISFNIYKNSTTEFHAPTYVDCPWLIGEFHFGTGSHGIWGSGLVPAMDLDHQAELYREYVNEVLEHPNFVGAHWFQWADHVTTGRYDGENYRIGMVSIVDRPYKTLIDTVKDVSQNMYMRRLKK